MNRSDTIRFNLPLAQEYLDVVSACVTASLERVRGLDESMLTGVQQSVRDALTNIVEQATWEQIEIVLTLDQLSQRLTIELGDAWQHTFDLPQKDGSDLDEIQVYGSGLGMGVYLVRQLMDKVTYQPQKGNNCWRLIKNLPAFPKWKTSTGQPETIQFDLPATHKYLNVLGASIEGLLAQVKGLERPEILVNNIQLALQEACTNIVNHAYAGESGRIRATLTLSPRQQQLVVELVDTGSHTFDISKLPDPFAAASGGNLLTGSALFFISATIVNAGNYVFNLLLGRWLGPAAFADLNLIVTLMLMVTFITTGFQQTAAKFAAIHAADHAWTRLTGLRRWLNRWASILGIGLLALIALGSPLWMNFFHTESTWPFVILAIGLPVYLLQGVDRGVLQGQMEFKLLALSYQAEMWVRLIIAVILVAIGWSVNGAVAAITISFVGTWLVARRVGTGLPRSGAMTSGQRRTVTMFAGTVVVAEISQILINNSDILIVKHFFNSEPAGQYAALALIGRVVFFATWSIVVTMFPVVAQKQQKGEPHRHLLGISLGLVVAVSLGVIAVSYFIPDFIVNMLFGEEYLSISPLLWLYAVATSLYALANVIINYRLSLGNGWGTMLAVIAGAAQVVGLWFFHVNLEQVVLVQIYIMAAFLAALLVWDIYLLWQEKRSKAASALAA